MSLAEEKQHLNLTGGTNDAELVNYLQAATELVEAKVGICVPRAITDEDIPGTRRDVIRLPSGPVPSVTAVTSIGSVYTDGPTWTTAGLIVNPARGTVRTADGCGFYRGPWRWTGTAGRAVIPERLTQACKEQVRHMWETQRGAQPPSVLQGEEIYSPAGGGAAFTVPRRVLELLSPDMVPGFA